MRYKVVRRETMKRTGEREVLQTAVQVTRGTVTLRDLSQQVSVRTSLGRGDVLNTIVTLTEVLGDYLIEGYIIDLDELGKLQPRLKARATPVGEQYTADLIEGINVRLLPSKLLKEKLKQARFRRAEE